MRHEPTPPDLYTLRRQVDLLRQQVFYPPADQPDLAMLEKLREAERRLAAVEPGAPPARGDRGR